MTLSCPMSKVHDRVLEKEAERAGVNAYWRCLPTAL
jgi:hypothetical protein